MSVYFTKKADNDLVEIAVFTKRKWGVKQLSIYFSSVDKTLKALDKNPKLGKTCDYIREGYFKCNVGKHIIFYKIIDKDIEVVRILHERMDIDNKFE